MFVDHSNTLPSLKSDYSIMEKDYAFDLQKQSQNHVRLPSINQLHSIPTSRTVKKHKTLSNQRVLLPMKCQSCQSSETPEWRKGPLGPRTLCNACGLIWTKLRKQEKDKKKTNETSTKYTLSYLLS
ncbi:unnamed protein product [Rhizopus stolonifer]